MEPYTRNRSLFLLIAVLGAVVWLSAARGDTAADAYAAIGLKTKNVLSGTTLTAKVMRGESKQLVCLTTYLTGKKDKTEAVNVRLDIFDTAGEKLLSRYTRDFGSELGSVGRGDLQLIDLDSDGVNEIIVAFDTYEDPLIHAQHGEVIVHDDSGFRTAWSGLLRFDATKAAREVPEERRDRFRRDLDFAATLKTRGATLYFNKTMIAVAGQRLETPKTVQETFPLKPRTDW